MTSKAGLVSKYHLPDAVRVSERTAAKAPAGRWTLLNLELVSDLRGHRWVSAVSIFVSVASLHSLKRSHSWSEMSSTSPQPLQKPNNALVTWGLANIPTLT